MLGEVHAHGLRRDLIVADGLEGAAVGRIDEQDNKENADTGKQNRHDRTQAEEYLAGSIRDVEVRKRRIALEDVGAVGNLAERLPLENGAQDLSKAERGDGQIVALEAQNRQTDQVREERSDQTRENDGHEHAEHQTHAAAEAGGAEQMLEHLLEGEVDARTLKEVIHAIARGVRDHEDRV